MEEKIREQIRGVCEGVCSRERQSGEVKNRKRKEDKKRERCQFESQRERYYNHLCV